MGRRQTRARRSNPLRVGRSPSAPWQPQMAYYYSRWHPADRRPSPSRRMLPFRMDQVRRMRAPWCPGKINASGAYPEGSSARASSRRSSAWSWMSAVRSSPAASCPFRVLSCAAPNASDLSDVHPDGKSIMGVALCAALMALRMDVGVQSNGLCPEHGHDAC
jgi:hypothetical protein